MEFDKSIALCYTFLLTKYFLTLTKKEVLKMATELKAPKGKIRVVGVDLFDHSNYLVDDFDDREEAFRKADEHNKKRPSSMDDVYHAYDDTGRYIRGHEHVGQEISP
jgi:hypothetical protein